MNDRRQGYLSIAINQCAEGYESSAQIGSFGPKPDKKQMSAGEDAPISPPNGYTPRLVQQCDLKR